MNAAVDLSLPIYAIDLMNGTTYTTAEIDPHYNTLSNLQVDRIDVIWVDGQMARVPAFRVVYKGTIFCTVPYHNIARIEYDMEKQINAEQEPRTRTHGDLDE